MPKDGAGSTCSKSPSWSTSYSNAPSSTPPTSPLPLVKNTVKEVRLVPQESQPRAPNLSRALALRDSLDCKSQTQVRHHDTLSNATHSNLDRFRYSGIEKETSNRNPKLASPLASTQTQECSSSSSEASRQSKTDDRLESRVQPKKRRTEFVPLEPLAEFYSRKQRDDRTMNEGFETVKFATTFEVWLLVVLRSNVDL
ncbi:uncharacterized protein JCM15063_004433 [Sporobolomyces koalae]|uniref:uncharacterized protein n=1 Tax=Sporobolomyces koalae TaxID=500713 RepID=UPI0031805E18